MCGIFSLHGTKAMTCCPEVHLAIENKVIDSGLQIASVPLTDSVKYCLWRQNALAVVNIQRGFALIDSYTKGAEHNVWRSLNKQIKIALLSPPKVTKNVRLARRFISRPFNLFQLEFVFSPSFCSELTLVCFECFESANENGKLKAFKKTFWSIRKHNALIVNIQQP